MIQLGYGFEPDEVVLSYYYNGINEYLIFTNHHVIFTNSLPPQIYSSGTYKWNTIEYGRIEPRYLGGILGNVLVIGVRNKGQQFPFELQFTFYRSLGIIFKKYIYDASKINLLEDIKSYIYFKKDEIKKLELKKQPKIKKLGKKAVPKQPKVLIWKFGKGKTRKIKREKISNKLKHQIWRRDDFKCQHCFRSIREVELEIDHIYPVSKGGETVISNLQTLCVKCNREKSNK